jgi:hypothetical protein
VIGVSELWRQRNFPEAQKNRFVHEVKKFFRAYYKELRKQIVMHPDANLPRWFKGGRRIITNVCNDGVVIVHRPYDEESQTFPDRDDSYIFQGQAVLVKELLARYIPPKPEDEQEPPFPDYVPGTDFGARYFAEPRQMQTPLGGDLIAYQETPWTRLDYASVYRIGAWSDASLAPEQARDVLRPYFSK